MEENARTSGLTSSTDADAADAADAEAADAADVAGSAEESTQVTSGPDHCPNPSRLNRKWLLSIAAVLTLLAGGTAFGGHQAASAHRKSEALEHANVAAISAAKDCVAATQPLDAPAVPAAQRKLTECSTADFGAQAAWYGAVLAQAYQAVDVRVQVPEVHAAVERNNDDGSIVALVAFRAVVSQTGLADRENSYRVRVKMVPEDGQFKVAELNQVAK